MTSQKLKWFDDVELKRAQAEPCCTEHAGIVWADEKQVKFAVRRDNLFHAKPQGPEKTQVISRLLRISAALRETCCCSLRGIATFRNADFFVRVLPQAYNLRTQFKEILAARS